MTKNPTGRHLSNISDHRREDAKTMHGYSSAAMRNSSAKDFEWQQHLEWITENVIGPPKATDHYTQEELEKMGMIGIYAR